MLRRIGCLGLLLALSAGVASAQVRSPNYDHIYCSGVYSTASVPYDTYVVSGEESRVHTTWAEGEYVYLNAGSAQGVKVGDEFQVLRPEKHKQRPKWFNSEPWLRRAMGKYWKDIGKLRVVVAESDKSVAQIVFSCEWMQRGDYVRPWADRPTPNLKRGGKFDRFAPATGRGAAMVVNVKHEGAQAGTNDIIYVNAGSGQGVKVGDYFRVFRYQGTRSETAYMGWNYAHSAWEFGKTPRWYKWDQIPREVVGEGVVLRVGENSSTVLVTYALREIYASDYVELENPEPMAEAAPAPAPAPRANRSPSMSCAADRPSVVAGERVRVTARATDPDGDALTYAWRSNGGQIVGSGSTVTFDTTGLRPGRYTVTGQASDGTSAAADCAVEVAVEGTAAPAQASKTNECMFRLASAGVDNVCKRILDDVALRLKNDPQSRLVLIGYADPAESGAARLAAQRADNAMQYLQSSGIAAARIDARSAGGQVGAGRTNRRVDIVWVPAGATY
jgi:outer membrane protein OmpA-like peptidoglycan-associated protein